MGVKVYGSGVGHSPAKNVGVQSLWGLSDGLFGYLVAIAYHYRYYHCDNNLTAKPYPPPPLVESQVTLTVEVAEVVVAVKDVVEVEDCIQNSTCLSMYVHTYTTIDTYVCTCNPES